MYLDAIYLCVMWPPHEVLPWCNIATNTQRFWWMLRTAAAESTNESWWISLWWLTYESNERWHPACTAMVRFSLWLKPALASLVGNVEAVQKREQGRVKGCDKVWSMCDTERTSPCHWTSMGSSGVDQQYLAVSSARSISVLIVSYCHCLIWDDDMRII